jgi:hypothetical protein
MDAAAHHPPPSPAEEQARLVKLRFQHEQGHLASPYSTFVAPVDVAHLAELRPPHSWGPWFEAWKLAVAHLAQQPSPQNQQRVAWLAQLTATGVLELGRLDPPRARAIRETALELLPDPGHKHQIRCVLSRGACLQHDLPSAEQWLAGCDPYPGNITLDTEYRMSSSYLHVAHGRPAAVLETLGGQPGAIPIDFGRDMLAGLLRVHAWEELGQPQGADAQFAWLFEEEKKLSGPILFSILKANAPLNLCRRTCARRGIQIPS